MQMSDKRCGTFSSIVTMKNIGQVFGGTYTAGEWPLRHNLRLYIRNDTLPTLWDYGVGAVSAGGLVDPYAEGEVIRRANHDH